MFVRLVLSYILTLAKLKYCSMICMSGLVAKVSKSLLEFGRNDSQVLEHYRPMQYSTRSRAAVISAKGSCAIGFLVFAGTGSDNSRLCKQVSKAKRGVSRFFNVVLCECACLGETKFLHVLRPGMCRSCWGLCRTYFKERSQAFSMAGTSDDNASLMRHF